MGEGLVDLCSDRNFVTLFVLEECLITAVFNWVQHNIVGTRHPKTFDLATKLTDAVSLLPVDLTANGYNEPQMYRERRGKRKEEIGKFCFALQPISH
ncbi:MAG TPA: hypothetical protein DDW76_04705 [Cyanobacteria bacterium UBA11369]|nr:hypothetical protein [Cyanobacteria bacterium UBA11371]HBE35579.1 hypothetical protein [Cyanobacteria bacterium UBA11368]HBE48107.1 hypothetical protein [Cyanobacteria bacterium UBA11369]